MREALRRLTAMVMLAGTLILSACTPTEFADTVDLLSDLPDIAGVDAGATPDTDTDAGSDPASGSDEWNIEDYPDYYRVDGDADFGDTVIPDAGTITYGTPDGLGRSTSAIGNITSRLREEGSGRERDMPDTITGWPDNNPKVEIDLGDGSSYHGYLFNRSHLIAKSLGGEDSAENMVTGTRMENVGRNQPPGGMAYTETLARDWLDANPDGSIIYKVTPNYEGEELLPRTVTVDMLSSDGALDMRVTVFNTANGYDIDYRNGGVL